MHYILFFIFVLISFPSFAACEDQAPFGRPVNGRTDTVALCRKAYTLEYDPLAKIPDWVSYDLTPQHAVGLPGCIARSNRFHADDELVAARAEKSDYTGSGFDIGHMANDGDMAWDADTEYQSFLLSNMAPQLPRLNRGVWRSLEVNTRAWAWGLQQDLVVYVGPVYGPADGTIGNGVKAPHAFFKILINRGDNSSIGFIMPNSPDVYNDIRGYQVAVDEIERQTGISFPVPGDKSVIQPIWPPYVKGFDKARKTSCPN